jgi:hypothetical protein
MTPKPTKGAAELAGVAPRFYLDGRLAQLVEQLTLNQRVVGSNPSASTIFLIFTSHFSNKLLNWAAGRFPLGSFLGSFSSGQIAQDFVHHEQ